MLTNETGISKFAFSELFERYYRPICYFVSQLTKNEQQAEDIAAECFQKLWIHRKNFQELQSVKAFLYKVARNAALDHLKSSRVRSVAHDEILYLSEQSEDFILAKIVKAQLLNHIYEKVEQMPVKVRVVFNLVYREGLSTREISQQLDTSEQHVRNVKTRALNFLKKSLVSRRST